jgi:hypothetical protein
MRTRLLGIILLFAFTGMMSAQMVSSHAPTAPTTASAKNTSATGNLVPMTQEQMASKVAIRVNGTDVSELDVRREMVSIFPYAMQHNGFPKDVEPQIRKGAVEMIIFEELLYQDAKRRNITISPEKFASAEAAFRKQFPSPAQYQQYIKIECKGSTEILHEKIRRSLLIEKMLKLEVTDKSVVTSAMVREYYEKNGKQYEHGETVDIQTISIVPPPGANKDVLASAQKKAEEAAKQAKQTKTAEQFGLLAEQVSDDDWHTKMGVRKTTEMQELPPMVATAAKNMKVGDVSDLIQVGNAWVVIRLNGHAMPGKAPFDTVQKQLSSDLQKQKTVEVRAALNQKLHQGAKIEVL